MDSTFTQDQLILLAYNELDTGTTRVIRHELTVNPDLQLRYNEILDTMSDLDRLFTAPSKTNVKIVLESSQSEDYAAPAE